MGSRSDRDPELSPGVVGDLADKVNPGEILAGKILSGGALPKSCNSSWELHQSW